MHLYLSFFPQLELFFFLFLQELTKKLESQSKEIQTNKKSKDKQLVQLVDAYKKQMELVHVLRQQKVAKS